jgi:dTDP-glucose pyrophosphorylase
LIAVAVHSVPPAQVSVGPDTPVRDVMQSFNTAHYPFRLVCDAAGRLLGTITDGDVRRGLLAGLTIAAPASACMKPKPVVGRVGDRWEDIEKPRGVTFLPLLDGEGVVRQVLVASDMPPPITTALVMAGGMGRRLGHHTRDLPKPLLPVRGKPILEHILCQLEDAGVSRIYVSVHYLHEKIAAFVEARPSRAHIDIVHEREMRGTAGALAFLSQYVGDLLVINGDLINTVNLAALARFHAEHGNDATVAVATYQHKIPFGVIRYDERGMFAGVDEKPVKHFPIVAGIYILSPSAIAITPNDRPIDMPDLLTMGMEMGLRIGTFPIHEYWLDVGRPADLAAAEEGPSEA